MDLSFLGPTEAPRPCDISLLPRKLAPADVLRFVLGFEENSPPRDFPVAGLRLLVSSLYFSPNFPPNGKGCSMLLWPDARLP